MTVASVADIVAQERRSGSSEADIVKLLRASQIKGVGRDWDEQMLTALFGKPSPGLARR